MFEASFLYNNYYWSFDSSRLCLRLCSSFIIIIIMMIMIILTGFFVPYLFGYLLNFDYLHVITSSVRVIVVSVCFIVHYILLTFSLVLAKAYRNVSSHCCILQFPNMTCFIISGSFIVLSQSFLCPLGFISGCLPQKHTGVCHSSIRAYTLGVHVCVFQIN